MKNIFGCFVSDIWIQNLFLVPSILSSSPSFYLHGTPGLKLDHEVTADEMLADMVVSGSQATWGNLQGAAFLLKSQVMLQFIPQALFSLLHNFPEEDLYMCSVEWPFDPHLFERRQPDSALPDVVILSSSSPGIGWEQSVRIVDFTKLFHSVRILNFVFEWDYTRAHL